MSESNTRGYIYMISNPDQLGGDVVVVGSCTDAKSMIEDYGPDAVIEFILRTDEVSVVEPLTINMFNNKFDAVGPAGYYRGDIVEMRRTFFD